MNYRLIAFRGALAATVAAALLTPEPGFGQSGIAAVEKAAAALAPKGWTPPRTPDGQLDLQGIWTNGFITPLERPADLAGKPFFTKEEAAAYETRSVQARNKDRRDGGAVADALRAYNDLWWDSGTQISKTLQTSLIVDPPDGRVPPLTPEAQQKLKVEAQAIKERCSQPGAACPVGNNGLPLPADGPEDRPYMERCISWPQGGPPMLPSAYDNNYQIVQTPGYVLIYVEMMHEARVIPLDGRPHIGPDVRQLMGDPRGHWEGNTLVVDTTNFSDQTRFRGAGPNMHLVERFTRTDPDTILYEFTVTDPSTFTRPWTAAVPMGRAKGPIFEYACNEGNVGLAGILRGARHEEQKGVADSEAGKASK